MRISGGCKFMTEKEIEVVMNALAGEQHLHLLNLPIKLKKY